MNARSMCAPLIMKGEIPPDEEVGGWLRLAVPRRSVPVESAAETWILSADFSGRSVELDLAEAK